MPIKMGSLSRESSSQAKFRIQLEGAVRSAVPGTPVDPVALEGLLAMVRSKEISAGEALSCFKYYFREGSPDEQYQALHVLAHFVGADPHLANHLHGELASRRWRERFTALAASQHPQVRPLLVSTLEGWAASYRAHDIGMHYQATLRELTGSQGGFRAGGAAHGPTYQPQHTGYSMQTTGSPYSAQPTGQGYPPPPPPGYPAPGGYHAPPGYPVYGTPVPYGAPPAHHHPPPPPPGPASFSSLLDQLTGEVESLRGACRAFESALSDYKAQRCPFATLSAAMDRGQRVADRCASLQGQLESMLGSFEGADEALMARIFSTNDSAVAAVDTWRKLANQELAPDDVPAAPAAAASSTPEAGPSASAAAAPPPQPPQPAPSLIDLLLGDELPGPTPPPAAAAAAAPSAAPAPQPSPAANGTATQGASTWGSAGQFTAAPPPPSVPAPAPTGASGLEAAAAAAAAAAAGGGSGAALGAGAAVVPATDVEGLRAQVLALAAELEKQRKVHATALEAQEAFHRSEVAQVRAQSAARIAELEAALARQQLQPPLPSPPPQQQQQPAGGANQFGGYGGSFGGAPAAATPAPAYGSSLLPYPPPPPLPSGVPSNNPFAAFAPPSFSPAAPSPSASLQTPLAAMLPPPGPTAGPATAAKDVFSGFDELAAGSRKSGGGAQLPMRASVEKPVAAPASMGAPAAAPVPAPAPALPPSAPGASAFGRPAAASAAAAAADGAAGSDGGSWVNFGH